MIYEADGVIKGRIQILALLLKRTFSETFLVFSSSTLSTNLTLAVIIPQ
jgi:hypothetical protein